MYIRVPVCPFNCRMCCETRSVSYICYTCKQLVCCMQCFRLLQDSRCPLYRSGAPTGKFLYWLIMNDVASIEYTFYFIITPFNFFQMMSSLKNEMVGGVQINGGIKKKKSTYKLFCFLYLTFSPLIMLQFTENSPRFHHLSHFV